MKSLVECRLYITPKDEIFPYFSFSGVGKLVDTAEKFIGGVVVTGKQFFGGVVDTGNKF